VDDSTPTADRDALRRRTLSGLAELLLCVAERERQEAEDGADDGREPATELAEP